MYSIFINVLVCAYIFLSLPFSDLKAVCNGILISRFCSYRSAVAMKTLNDDEIDVLEGGKLERDREKTIRSNKTVKIRNQALLSGFAYCISSCSMILVNKYVLSSYDFNAGISLMLYQVIFHAYLCYLDGSARLKALEFHCY